MPQNLRKKRIFIKFPQALQEGEKSPASREDLQENTEIRLGTLRDAAPRLIIPYGSGSVFQDKKICPVLGTAAKL